jgi:hypothetical protein
MLVNVKDYENDKMAFFKKHNFDYKVLTSDMESNRYQKVYVFEDGAEWYELSGKIIEEAEFKLHGLSFRKDVELFKTEFWSSEATSKYFYEKW